MALTKVKLIADGTIVQSHLNASHGITTADISEGSNLYYTDTRARSAISVSGNALSYNSSTGVITSNYEESPTFTGNVTINGSFTSQGIDDNADATAITINGNEEVGIGTTSPFVKLHVETTASQIARFSYNSTNYQDLTYEGSNIVGGSHVFKIAGSEKMRLDTSGNLGIGTTSPNTELEVRGTGTGQFIQSDVSASFDADGLTKHTRFRISSSNTASSNAILEIRSRKSDSQWRSNAITNLNGEMAFLISSTNNAEPTSSDEAMRIDSSGQVKINTTTNQFGEKLTVDGWIVSSNGTRVALMGQNSDGAIFGSYSNNNLIFRTNNTEKVRIDTSGNVGIGTTTPGTFYPGDHNLVVGDGNSDSAITVYANPSNTSYLLFADGTSGSSSYTAQVRYNHSTNHMEFATNNSTAAKMTLDDNGDLGIGITSPSQKLHVVGTIYTNTGNFKIDSGYELSWGNGNTSILGNTATGYLDFRTSNSTKMYINSSGNVGIGYTSPQFKLHVVGASTTEATVARFAKGNFADSGGHTTIIGLGTENSASWTKAALAFERTGSYDRGKIHFLQENTGNTDTTTLSDSVMSITPEGYVGIGASSPTEKLTVGGNILANVSNNGTIKAQYDSNNFSQLQANSSGGVFTADAGGATKILLRSYGDSYFTGGSVAIGETSPNGKLDIKQNMTAGTTAAFTSPHLRLSANNTVDNTGFVGMTFATSTANNYGFSWGALRTTSALGGMHLRYHGNSASGTDIFSIDYVGNVTIATQRYIRSDSSGGYLTIQGGATYPGGRIDMYGGSNASAGIQFLTGGTTATPTERMRIASDGQVTVTGSSTTMKLYNGSSFTGVLHFGNADFLLGFDSGIFKQRIWDGADYFNAIEYSGSSHRLILAPSEGSVGIGLTSPSDKLHVDGGTGSNYAGHFVYGGTNGAYGCLKLRTVASTGPSFIDFFYDGFSTSSTSPVGAIVTTGTATLYSSYSDYRLKENVADLTGALDKVNSLQPKTFNYINTPETTNEGFIAHELQEIVPQAVSGIKDGVDEDGNPKYQGVDNAHIVPLLVGAIKELKAEIEILKAQINN